MKRVDFITVYIGSSLEIFRLEFLQRNYEKTRCFFSFGQIFVKKLFLSVVGLLFFSMTLPKKCILRVLPSTIVGVLYFTELWGVFAARKPNMVGSNLSIGHFLTFSLELVNKFFFLKRENVMFL